MTTPHTPLADAIRRYRTAAGLTQEGAAHALGLTMITWSRWELGVFEPTVARLRQIAALLNCHVTDFLTDPPNPEGEPVKEDYMVRNRETGSSITGVSAGDVARGGQRFEWTTIGAQRVILTAGSVVAGSGQVFGLFTSPTDALSDDPDTVAVGTVGRSVLTPDQIAMAERNSQRLTT